MNPFREDQIDYNYISPTPSDLTMDYSKFIRGKGIGLIRDCSETGIDRVLSLANENHPLTFRGGGFSCGGIAVAKKGILFDNLSSSPSSILNLDEKNLSATIPSGATWGAVERELLQRGFRVPVLPDFMKLSVGGTLSVGGIGVDSLRNGFQADLIREAEIALPHHGSIRCTPTEEPELFRFSAGATGNSGLIRNVTIRIEPKHDGVRVFKKRLHGLQDLSSFITDPLFYENSAMDHFQAWYSNGKAVCEAGDYLRNSSPHSAAVPVNSFFRSGWDEPDVIKPSYPFSLSDRREAWIAGFPDPVQVWSDFFFSAKHFREFLSHLHEIESTDPRFSFLKAIYILIVRRPEDPHPSPFLPGKAGDFLFSAGLYSMAHRMDPLEISSCLAFMGELTHDALALGGVPYQYGFPGPGHSLNHISFHGAAFASLREFRSRSGLSATGYLE